jgi:DNA-binding response OmpR family regulator
LSSIEACPEERRVLAGKRILIVEDEPLIALDLENAIVDHEGIVIGPAGSIAQATQLAESETIDGAILDLRLGGELALSVAECLRGRQVPFVIYSGQADTTLPRNWPTAPIVGKPAPPEDVIALLVSVMQCVR